MGKDKCKETVSDGTVWSRSYPCRNRAKYGDYCGVHSPEKIAERSAKRGPTRCEREITEIKASQAELTRLRRIVAQAREVDGSYFSTNDVPLWEAMREQHDLLGGSE